ncbi:MAG: hypothetical protein FWC68_05635, partial [Oscillospiraceae bacterium]|nr:hypothetical protein [Oscillospiraceae bacterium]
MKNVENEKVFAIKKAKKRVVAFAQKRAIALALLLAMIIGNVMPQNILAAMFQEDEQVMAYDITTEEHYTQNYADEEVHEFEEENYDYEGYDITETDDIIGESFPLNNEESIDKIEAETKIEKTDMLESFGTSLFSATITGEGQTVDFTNSGQNPFTVGLRSSVVQAQTLSVRPEFSSLSNTDRIVMIELSNGLGLSSVPGMSPAGTVPVDRVNNWTENLAGLPGSLSAINGARFIQNNEIYQTVSGNRFQPRAGTIIYSVGPGTVSLPLDLGVTSDWAFAAGLGVNSRNNAIRVTTFEGENINQLFFGNSVTTHSQLQASIAS